jgi:hypothetical protein
LGCRDGLRSLCEVVNTHDNSRGRDCRQSWRTEVAGLADLGIVVLCLGPVLLLLLSLGTCPACCTNPALAARAQDGGKKAHGGCRHTHIALATSGFAHKAAPALVGRLVCAALSQLTAA